jgi:hypothetical protein
MERQKCREAVRAPWCGAQLGHRNSNAASKQAGKRQYSRQFTIDCGESHEGTSLRVEGE